MACTAKSDVAETGTNNKSSLIHESKVDINEDGIKSIHQLEKDENINSFNGEISLNSLRLKTESEDHVFESQSTQETGNSIENNYQPDVQENKNIEEEIANCDNNSCKDSNTVQVTSVNDMSHISNTQGTNDNAPEYFSDQSESGDEYESASEGEEIQTDSVTLKELEERLTDEEKQDRQISARELKEEGNQLFRDGSYKSAIRTYSRGLRICPLKYDKDRAVLYANRAACKVKLEEFDAAIKDCSKAIDLNPDYLKALIRRAELYEQTEKLDEALADYQKILELDPSQHKARAACMKLPDMIKERNEKLKEEMMGKLKELGNMVLRPFGLSTNNFKLNQDPNTGGYSVNFVQNPNSGE